MGREGRKEREGNGSGMRGPQAAGVMHAPALAKDGPGHRSDWLL